MAQTSKSNGKASAPSPEDMAAQIDGLKEDISALTKLMADYTDGAQDKAKARFESAADLAKAYGEATMEEAKVRAADAGAHAKDFVAERPGVALGLAAGLGFLIGAMGARR